MLCTMQFTMVDGHIIVTSEDGEKCLVDTGSPWSVGNAQNVMFAGGRHPLRPYFMGKSVDELTGPIGVRIDALIGTDILNHYDMIIDQARGVLDISDEEIDVEGEVLPLEQVMGVPTVMVVVGGRRIKMFFDTGAKISYVGQETAEAHPKCATSQDFHVILGEFTVVIHRVPIMLGSCSLEMDLGAMPQLLQSALRLAGTEGILGTAILSHFRAAYLPRWDRIVLLRLSKK